MMGQGIQIVQNDQGGQRVIFPEGVLPEVPRLGQGMTIERGVIRITIRLGAQVPTADGRLIFDLLPLQSNGSFPLS